MTVTSDLSDHYDKLDARAERTQEQEREDKAAPSGGSHKDPEREKVGFIENTAMRHRWGG